MTHLESEPLEGPALPATDEFSAPQLAAKHTIGLLGVALVSTLTGYLIMLSFSLPVVQASPVPISFALIPAVLFILWKLFSLRYRVDKEAKRVRVEIRRCGLVTTRTFSFRELRFLCAEYYPGRSHHRYCLYLITERGFRLRLTELRAPSVPKEHGPLAERAEALLRSYAELFSAEALPIGRSRYYFFPSRFPPKGEGAKGGYLRLHGPLVYLFGFICFLTCINILSYPLEFFGTAKALRGALQFGLPAGLYLYLIAPWPLR